jgi:hypothetical protein
VDVHASLTAPCSADELFRLVDDLGKYPAWIDLVHRADSAPAGVAGDRVWDVELRARVGPFARSKRLRMWRSVHDPLAHRVVFERREVDGRRHSPWQLTAELAPTGSGSELHMHLHYGGSLWTGGVLERVLADQITSGRERLLEMVQPTP